MKNSFLLLISFYLVSCTATTTPEIPTTTTPETPTTTTPETPEERYEKFFSEISVEKDEFKKTTWVYSAEIPDDNTKSPGNVWCNEYSDCLDAKFRSFFDKNNKLIFRQIYFVAKIPEWIFFNSAVFDDGTNLKFTEIDRRVISGDYLKEVFAVIITEEQYEKMKKRIRKISLRGKYSRWTINIPIEIVTSLDKYIRIYFQ